MFTTIDRLGNTSSFQEDLKWRMQHSHEEKREIVKELEVDPSRYDNIFDDESDESLEQEEIHEEIFENRDIKEEATYTTIEYKLKGFSSGAQLMFSDSSSELVAPQKVERSLKDDKLSTHGYNRLQNDLNSNLHIRCSSQRRQSIQANRLSIFEQKLMNARMKLCKSMQTSEQSGACVRHLKRRLSATNYNVEASRRKLIAAFSSL